MSHDNLDRNQEPSNVSDAIFAVSHSIDRFADLIAVALLKDRDE